MNIVRRYDGESEWEPVEQEAARKVLVRFYDDVDAALAEIEAGHSVRSNAAEYRKAAEAK